MPRIPKSTLVIAALLLAIPPARAATTRPLTVPRLHTNLQASLVPGFQASGGTATLRNGAFRIDDTPKNRLALHHMLEIAQFRFQTAATNIVNMDTTLDADGKNDPYLRLLVTVDSAGQVHAIPDPTAIILKYEPANPCADANGFVKVPAITLDEESLNLKFTVTEFETATTALKEFKGR